MIDARASAEMVAAKLGLRPEEVLVCSTGVIGVPMPMDVMRGGIEAVELSEDSGHNLALAIMTTDLQSKESAVTVDIGGRTVTVAGTTKGSGMIHPDMANDACVHHDGRRYRAGMPGSHYQAGRWPLLQHD